jgi:hypothetical protein
MTQADDLAESLRHIEYEMAMMIAAPRMADLHKVPRPDGYQWANDRDVTYLAGLESALTHARLLDDFFSYTTQPTGFKANDRYAFEYCEGWSGFKMLTTQERTAIDKQLSHLTTQRKPRKAHAVHHYARQAVEGLTRLTEEAEPEWQPRLRDILAKAHAEQQRNRDPWNPGN